VPPVAHRSHARRDRRRYSARALDCVAPSGRHPPGQVAGLVRRAGNESPLQTPSRVLDARMASSVAYRDIAPWPAGAAACRIRSEPLAIRVRRRDMPPPRCRMPCAAFVRRCPEHLPRPHARTPGLSPTRSLPRRIAVADLFCLASAIQIRLPPSAGPAFCRASGGPPPPAQLLRSARHSCRITTFLIPICSNAFR
jgi:hypothetical protein